MRLKGLIRNTCPFCQEKEGIWRISHFFLKEKKSSYSVSGTYCYNESLKQESTNA